jgi:hypothetical protein
MDAYVHMLALILTKKIGGENTLKKNLADLRPVL